MSYLIPRNLWASCDHCTCQTWSILGCIRSPAWVWAGLDYSDQMEWGIWFELHFTGNQKPVYTDTLLNSLITTHQINLLKTVPFHVCERFVASNLSRFESRARESLNCPAFWRGGHKLSKTPVSGRSLVTQACWPWYVLNFEELVFEIGSPFID